MAEITYRPVNDSVVLRPKDAFSTASGLELPQGYADDAHGSDRDMIRERNQLCLAEVVDVGPGYKYAGKRKPKGVAFVRPPLDVTPGDQVLYNRADAKRLKGTDELLVVIKHHAIFAIVEGSVRQVVGGIVSV